ncbi:hypothetical protein EV687_2053 [Corticibacter populi]|nr:hypothetical protein EV687_2053 [Corticibacter populi]
MPTPSSLLAFGLIARGMARTPGPNLIYLGMLLEGRH